LDIKNKNMKPFNKERALAGDPVIRGDGQKVSRLVHFPEATNGPFNLVAVIDGKIYTFTEKGKYYSNYDADRQQDIFMAPKKVTYSRKIVLMKDGRCSLVPESMTDTDILFSFERKGWAVADIREISWEVEE